jgi:4-amino-4-deoxy-L-arabinose transferase-like glycosyltransferase
MTRNNPFGDDSPAGGTALPSVLVALGCMAVFLLLFLFRFSDDNRLFSWKWAITAGMLPFLCFSIAVGLALAYGLSRSQFLERHPAASLFIVAFLSSALLWPEPEMIMDASRYFTQAKHLEVYGVGYFLRQWGREISAWTDLPAVPFLYGVLFKTFGEHRVVIQIFSTCMFSLTLVLTYLIGKTLWSEELGRSAGLLLIGMPFLLTQVPLMLVDVPTMFLLTLTVYAFLKALEPGGARHILFASLSLTVTFFSKFSAWLLLSVLGVMFVVYSRRDFGTTLRRFGLALVLPVVVAGGIVMARHDVLCGQIRFLMSFQKPGLERWKESFLSTLFYQVHPFITIAAAYSLLRAVRSRDLRYGIVLWPILVVLIFDIERSRYLLPVFPMLALMAAYGLQAIEWKQLRSFIVLAIAVVSIVVTVFAYLPFARIMSAVNIKNAGAYLDSRDLKEVMVITTPLKDAVADPAVAVPLLDLFTGARIRYAYHPGSFSPPPDVESRSLRFTWEYRNPKYYSPDQDHQRPDAVAMIAGERSVFAPPVVVWGGETYHLEERFSAASDPFRYKTVIFIYTPGVPLQNSLFMLSRPHFVPAGVNTLDRTEGRT